MKINQAAIAGTMESSDIMVTIEPSEKPNIDIELSSTVLEMYGDHIHNEIRDLLKSHGISSAKVVAVDKGALDCTIRARTSTALYRACGQLNESWTGGADNG